MASSLTSAVISSICDERSKRARATIHQLHDFLDSQATQVGSEQPCPLISGKLVSSIERVRNHFVRLRRPFHTQFLKVP